MSNLSDPVIQAIVAARVSLLFDHPFYGNIATRCKLVASDHGQLDVPYEEMIYDPHFIRQLTPDELTQQIKARIDALVEQLQNQPAQPDDLARREFVAALLNASCACGPARVRTH